MQYKILFVGLGSIGRRHLHNIIATLKERNIDFQIDAIRTESKEHEGISNVYTKKEKLPNDYDIVFITNPTSLHYEIMLFLKNKTKHFFVEKPIFDKIREFSFNQGVCYVACPLRFHPVIRNLKNFAQNNGIVAFRAICSSYLPNWRLGIDYENSYSAKRSMGGGVNLDLIHEIDYLKWVFGKPKKISAFCGKKSNLKIDSNDIAMYVFEFSDTLGSLHLDYFGRYQQKTKREIEIFTNDDTFLFDITNYLVKSSRTDIKEYFPEEDIYMNEIRYFFDTMESNAKCYYNSPVEALESLKIAQGEM